MGTGTQRAVGAAAPRAWLGPGPCGPGDSTPVLAPNLATPRVRSLGPPEPTSVQCGAKSFVIGWAPGEFTPFWAGVPFSS